MKTRGGGNTIQLYLAKGEGNAQHVTATDSYQFFEGETAELW
jgi:hypothetical protein